jgi:phosphoribosylamine--glycine ligase
MKRAGLPVPRNKTFSKESYKDATDYALSLLEGSETVFFKASGLFAGKGVIPVTNDDEVLEALTKISKMGPAGEKFLVEEGMVGEEFSYYAMVDGTNYVCFKSAQDNKRVWNRDKGPNTGGMGCNAPALVTKGLEAQIERELVAPQVAQLAREGTPYVGILYIGGMVKEDGSLGIVEDNSRWGDPECHVILPGLRNNYLELVNKAIDGKLDEVELDEDGLTRVCVIGASAGYPGSYEKGKRLHISKELTDMGVEFLSAGIKVQDGEMYTNGGRVFSLVGKGHNVIVAREAALKAMAGCYIEGNGLQYRTDIACTDIERAQKAQA